jgi:hypothetical protein
VEVEETHLERISEQRKFGSLWVGIMLDLEIEAHEVEVGLWKDEF